MKGATKMKDALECVKIAGIHLVLRVPYPRGSNPKTQ